MQFARSALPRSDGFRFQFWEPLEKDPRGLSNWLDFYPFPQYSQTEYAEVVIESLVFLPPNG